MILFNCLHHPAADTPEILGLQHGQASLFYPNILKSNGEIQKSLALYGKTDLYFTAKTPDTRRFFLEYRHRSSPEFSSGTPQMAYQAGNFGSALASVRICA
ncbi:hypothetical protein [Pararhizobium qamdonense]|uniref:hypothetical protein n=1 Tax=Pararhizobium qamdonense TaxID=3031126 RepID=UPI0023E161AC|nr:hypothetical protein [Pararhizobium qamdonense]